MSMASKGSHSLGPDIKAKSYEYKPPLKSTYTDPLSKKTNSNNHPPPKPKPSPQTPPPITRPPRDQQTSKSHNLSRGKEVKKDPISRSVEYKPTPYNPIYREYKPTNKSYKWTQLEHNGNVEYKLTKDNNHAMNNWKRTSTDNKKPIAKKKAPIVTPPPPRKTPTPTPPPPKSPTPPPPKSPTPPPPKSPTPVPRRHPSPKPLPVIIPAKRKETPPPNPPPPPPPTPPPPRPRAIIQEFDPKSRYPPEVIACVQAYLMAHRHAPYKVTPTSEPFSVPPSSKDLPPEVEALLSAYYSLHSIR